MHPWRVKSATSYRMLGERSVDCVTHRSIEHEYNMVRAVVDAMANQIPPAPRGSSSLPSGAWLRHNARPASGMPNLSQGQGLNTQSKPLLSMNIRPVRPLSSKSEKTTPIIDIDDLLNDRNNPQLLQQKRLATQTSEDSEKRTPSPAPQWKGHHPKRRSIVFGFQTREMMTQKSTVLPVAPQSQSRLQLTGDVKKIYDLKTSPREIQAVKGLPRGILVHRSETDKENTRSPSVSPALTERVAPNATMNANTMAALREQQPTSYSPAQTETQRTTYRLKIKPEHRPKTSPSWRMSASESAEHSKRNRPISGNDKFLSKSVVRKISAPQLNMAVRKPKENTATPDLAGTTPTEAEIPSKGVEGKTEMTKATGTLTLSIFLPREKADVRVCQRADHANMTPAADEKGNFGVDYQKPSRDSQNSDDKNVEAAGELSQPAAVTCAREHAPDGVCSAGSPLTIDTRRAIHCELFGPDLCHDCQLHHELADLRRWQNHEYPDIGTDPKRLVAGPKLRSEFASFGPFTSPKPRYGDHFLRMAGYSKRLDSLVTQNEIRKRIWASSAPPRSRQQKAAV